MSKSSIPNRKSKIFLYGPSGAGKSTVGQILADNLNIPFVDLDEEIESRSGLSIPKIFAQEGESGFREREAQALDAVLALGESVIALGGGALTRPQNEEKAREQGHIILLTASLDTLASRLQGDDLDRPLLRFSEGDENGAILSNLHDLMTRREDHYNSFPVQVDTGGQSPQAVAWQIQIRLGSFHLKAMAGAKHPGYDVRVQSGSLGHLGTALRARNLNGPVAVVTDSNVGPYYLDPVVESLTTSGYQAQGITIPAGEDHKTLKNITKIWDAFLAARIERGSTIIALGGGVLGDLAGFAAATFLRSVPWVVVPTSLLAMVDSSLGGKTGADLPQGKNLIGAFYPPRLVWVDPDVLDTLPSIEMVNGMAEVLKHGVIADPDLFDRCRFPKDVHTPEIRDQIVRQGMAVKVKFIETDPFEAGIRAALNYGHTVGHGVERASNYSLRHGEAVAIGMVVEARLAEQIGLAGTGLADRISAVLKSLGLPGVIPSGLDRDAIRTAMLRDKKVAGGVVRFALPAAIGDVRVGVDVPGWEDLIF